MAKVQAPFLSLGARGSIGGVLTASVWKGIKTMRQKSDPANPNTAAQQAQRGKMAAAVDFWRTIITGSATVAAVKGAWNVVASYASRPLSGFNSYTSVAIALLKTSVEAVIGYDVTEVATVAAAFNVNVECRKIDGGGSKTQEGEEATCYYGTEPDQLVGQQTLDGDAGGGFTSAATWDTGEIAGITLYYQVQTDQGDGLEPITGIHSVLLT